MPSGHATIPPRPFRRGFWSALLRSATWGLVIVLALGAIPSAWGQETELKPSVEPALLRQIQKNDTAGYMIYFREKADLSAAQGMDWQARGRFVTQRLRETAERSQKRVRGYLDAAGASYTPFWIDNIIVVKSSRRATFSGLLAFSEIESLKVRRTMQLIKPEKTDARKVLDQVNDVESNLTHIGANTVWGWGYGGQNVVVANIDTGVRFSHEALVNQYRGNLGDGAFDHNYNWHDPYGDHPNAPADDNGHGTHTMGTMVGEGGGNSIGVAPHARWIAARGCNTSSCTDAALLSSAQWIAAPTNLAGQAPDPDKRPHVVNNSWGDCGAAYDGWYQDVVNAWHAAGIYPVFSNGNASNCGYSAPPGLNTVGNPGRYGNVTGVGSSGKSNGQYAPHSNWGPTDNADTVNPRGYAHLKPQVVAPGVDIRSSVPTSDTSYEDGWTGTSMSAPHVTGLIALMWSAAPHLIGNYAVTETLLEETATPIPYASAGTPPPGPGNVPNYATGWGEINAPAAVQAAMALADAGTLQGAVRGTGGAPLAGARVDIFDGTNTWTVTTDAAGNYQRPTAAGTYDVTASSYGYLPSTAGGVEVSKDQTTTQNFALTEAPHATVQGTVRDAATGWPLYARVYVSEYPGPAVWTDPISGHYQVSLPTGGTYALEANAQVCGYSAQGRSVGPLQEGRTEDFALSPDLGACTAPGYGFANPLYHEDFEASNGGFFASGTPADLWAWGVPVTWPGRAASGTKCWGTNLQGEYASDADAVVTSQVISLAGASGPLMVRWQQALEMEDSFYDRAYAEVSINDGPWTVMWEHTGGDVQEDWTSQAFDLSAAAGGTVQFRFRIETDDSLNFNGYYIDDIAIGRCTAPAAGGLVVGNVRDANTASGLVDADVTVVGGASTWSIATPDDPAVDDGFYTLFATPGTRTLSADKEPLYGTGSGTVTVTHGATVRRDLDLPTPRFQAQPSSLAATITTGTTSPVPFALTNTGGRAGTFRIFTSSQWSSSAQKPWSTAGNPGGKAAVKGTAGNRNTTDRGTPVGKPVLGPASGGPKPTDIGNAWEVKTPLPQGRAFAAVVAGGDGAVYVAGGTEDAGGALPTDTLYRYDTATDSWSSRAPLPVPLQDCDGVAVEGKIYLPGDDTTADTFVYDMASDSWSTIPANNGYSPRWQYKVAALGSQVYVVGGFLVDTGTATTEVWILDTDSGQWTPGVPLQKARINFALGAVNGMLYAAGGVDFPGFTPEMTTEKFDGSSWTYGAPVPSGGGAYTRWSYMADGLGKDGLWLAGGRRDANWDILNHAGFYDPADDAWTDSPTIPLLNQPRVYCGGDVADDGYFYVIGGRNGAGDTLYATNERLFVGSGGEGVPWLSLSPDRGAIGAGGNLPLQVIFRADVPEATSPGTYQARIRVQSSSPYGTLTVPVTMTVLGAGTPTPVPTVVPTNTPVPQPTNTPAPTATPTVAPTQVPPTATPVPTAVPTVAPTQVPPQPTATPVPTGEPTPTAAPVTPTVAPTNIPVPTAVPVQPTPMVQEGAPVGNPTPLPSDQLPKTGGNTQDNVSLPPEVVRQILGDQVLADAYQLAEVKNGEAKTFNTTTGFVTLTVTSTATAEGGTVYRWTMLIWNNATQLWETVTGEIVTAGTARPAFEASATTLRSRLADGGSYDLDGIKNGTVQTRTAMALLAAPGTLPTTAPTSGPTSTPTNIPSGTGGGGCAVQSWGSFLPFALLLLPLALLGKR